MDKWGYSYLIELQTLWEKGELLITSDFSFSHNVFKSCLLLMCQSKYLWSKGLKESSLVITYFFLAYKIHFDFIRDFFFHSIFLGYSATSEDLVEAHLSSNMVPMYAGFKDGRCQSFF